MRECCWATKNRQKSYSNKCKSKRSVQYTQPQLHHFLIFHSTLYLVSLFERSSKKNSIASSDGNAIDAPDGTEGTTDKTEVSPAESRAAAAAAATVADGVRDMLKDVHLTKWDPF